MQPDHLVELIESLSCFMQYHGLQIFVRNKYQTAITTVPLQMTKQLYSPLDYAVLSLF